MGQLPLEFGETNQNQIKSQEYEKAIIGYEQILKTRIPIMLETKIRFQLGVFMPLLAQVPF